LLVWRPGVGLERRDWWVISLLSGFGLLGMLMAWWGGEGGRGFDNPSRYLLAVPALLLLLACPPRPVWLWGGVAVGAMGAGVLALWQRVVEGVGRPGGFTQIIQFGDISILFGGFCLAGLGWAAVQQRRGLWLSLMLLGAVGGFLGSIFSGSRGGWVVLPLILLVLYIAYRRCLTPARRWGGVSGVVLLLLLVWVLPQSGMQSRVEQAVSQVDAYFTEGNRASSVGYRFEMWRGASRLFLEKPLLGWGQTGYEAGMRQLGESGVIHPRAARYSHAHNQFLDSATKYGVVGLVALLALYLVPFALFAGGLSAPSLSRRAVATAGVLLPVSFMGFSLTQAVLTHHSGVLVYAFWLAILWGLYRRSR